MANARTTKLENLNFYGNKTQMKKRFRDIVKDLGSRDITLEDILNPESKKQLGLKEVLKDNQATLNDLVILQQFSKAILESDTRAAEFLRDTAGEKPSTQLDVTSTQNPISNLSDSDLAALVEGLRSMKEKGLLDD